MRRASPKKRLARLAEVLAILKEGNVVSTVWLANKLGVSQRAIYRDIGSLRNRGLRIDGSTGHGGGVMLRRERRRA